MSSNNFYLKHSANNDIWCLYNTRDKGLSKEDEEYLITTPEHSYMKLDSSIGLWRVYDPSGNSKVVSFDNIILIKS